MSAKKNTPKKNVAKETRSKKSVVATKAPKDTAPPNGAGATLEQPEAQPADVVQPQAPKEKTQEVPMAAPTKKLSALNAAVKVLGELDQAMTCPELIVAMAAKGYWTSPGGQTPASTLYAAVTREIKVQGDQSRFQKVERGKFMLAATR
jgi:hypothetical protein